MSHCSLRRGCLAAALSATLAIPLSYAWASKALTDRAGSCRHHSCFQTSASGRGGEHDRSEWRVTLLSDSLRPETYVDPAERAGRSESRGGNRCAGAVSAVGLVPHCTTPTPAPRSRVGVRHARTGEVMAMMDVSGASTGAEALPLEEPVVSRRQPRVSPDPEPLLHHVCHGSAGGNTIEANLTEAVGSPRASSLVLDAEQRMKLMRQLRTAVHHL